MGAPPAEGWGRAFDDTAYAEGTEWPDGDRLFRIGRLRRKDAVPDRDWAAVWSVMRTLANLHGDEGVRLVVWFYG